MQPRLHLGGQAVPREQAAGLLALVDELRRRLDVPPIDEIRLEDAEFNAGVLELGPTCFRWRTRRILFLGVPFLAAVDAAALRAVIAHELGHFSRRHGRLGHWLWRAQAAAEDTHPRVAERCAALGVDVPDAAQVQPAAPCAGAAIFGTSWPLRVNERDRRWQAAHRRTWAMDHAAAGALAAHHAGLLAQALDTPERWRLEAVLGDAVDAAAWAVRAASAAAQTPEGLYLVGRALLEQGDADGVQWPRRCIRGRGELGRAGAPHAGRPGPQVPGCHRGPPERGTAVLQAEGIDEDQLAEDLRGLLLQWLPENRLARVQTRLTTETLEPGLQRGLAACVPLG